MVMEEVRVRPRPHSAFPSPRRGKAGSTTPVWESQATWLQPFCSRGDNWSGCLGAFSRNSVWWPKRSPREEAWHCWQHLSRWHSLLQKPQPSRTSFLAIWGLAQQSGCKWGCIQMWVSVGVEHFTLHSANFAPLLQPEVKLLDKLKWKWFVLD